MIDWLLWVSSCSLLKYWVEIAIVVKIDLVLNSNASMMTIAIKTKHRWEAHY